MIPVRFHRVSGSLPLQMCHSIPSSLNGWQDETLHHAQYLPVSFDPQTQPPSPPSTFYQLFPKVGLVMTPRSTKKKNRLFVPMSHLALSYLLQTRAAPLYGTREFASKHQVDSNQCVTSVGRPRSCGKRKHNEDVEWPVPGRIFCKAR